jgi:hypothetical protein
LLPDLPCFLSSRYERGQSICAIAKKVNYPPASTARLILDTMLERSDRSSESKGAGGERGGGGFDPDARRRRKAEVKRMMHDPGKYVGDARLRQEIAACEAADHHFSLAAGRARQ